MVEFAILFLLLFFVTNTALKYFFPGTFGGTQTARPPVILSMQSSKIRLGNDPVAKIENTTDKDLTLPPRCPNPPVDIALVQKAPDDSEQTAVIIPNEAVLPCTELTVIKAKETATVNLASWKYALFEQPGTYEVSLELPEGFQAPGQPATVSARFSVVEPGFFTKLFRTFISKPLFNALIFIGTWVPGHSLAWSIIILTLIIKFALLIPNQHAL
jgi:hypothetical protein